MFSFFRKKTDSETASEASAPRSRLFESLDDLVVEHMEGMFEPVLSKTPVELCWDTAFYRDGGDWFYRFLPMDTMKPVKVLASKAPGFIAEYKTLSICVPSDKCGTSLFSWFTAEGDVARDKSLRSAVAHNVETCSFASLDLTDTDGYRTGIASSVPDGVRTALEDLLDMFFSNGGSVTLLCDRVFPLTYYAEASLANMRDEKTGESLATEHGETVLCLERRGDFFTAWNCVNLHGTLVPANSAYTLVSEIKPRDDLFKNLVYLTSELVRIHKFAPPRKGLFIDSGFSSDVDIARPLVIQAMKDTSKSMENIGISETADAALLGLAKAV